MNHAGNIKNKLYSDRFSLAFQRNFISVWKRVLLLSGVLFFL